MKKLVVLKFDGNFDSGFQVSLEIANEGERAYRTFTATLPSNIDIPELLKTWHTTYCSRYSQPRIKIIKTSSLNCEALNQECTSQAISLLNSFNQWLNISSFSSIVNSLKELKASDEIRIIIATSCHELRQLPWHLWDALNKFTLVEVALSSPNAERGERPFRDKIRILIILGDSSNINIEADRQYLQTFCGAAEIILLQQPSRDELNNYLQDNLGWDMLFFSGHSETQGMQGKIYLNNKDSLTMAELRDALQVAIKRRLQIAFFNSCDGLGIAYELEQLNIPQVIVMREPVPDTIAQEFLKYFLQEFTAGKSLYISVRNARLELQKLESEFPCASWLPVIIQNQTETPPTWQSLGIISFCPYQGLSAFQENNAEYFFGRDKATASLVAAVNSKPLVAVVGASGSGKSSLVFAGLIPQLRQDTINNWLILSFRPGKNPFASLAVALISALNLPEDERRLAQLELEVNLKRDSTTLQNFITYLNPSPHILLIADQFEEIYTLCTDAKERKVFFDGLLQAIKNAPFFTLLLTIRADFLSKALDDYEPFGRALIEYQLEPVARMSREELEEAITLPAKKLGFEFEQGLCNTIIDNIQDGDGRLPLLEFTLSQLWKHQHAGKLTHQAYDKIGGIEKALANNADAVYANLSESERSKAQQVFIQLVQPGEGTEDTRRLATSEEVGQDNWDLVTHLASERLVVTNRNESTNEETVEVVHEALIRHWKRLREWMQENRKFRIWQQGLMVALQQWVDSNRDDGALLRGTPLFVAEEWLQQRSGEVSKPQRWFIEKSVELRERERKQKQRLRRSVIAGLLCSLLVISGFAAVSEIRRIDAEINRLNVSADRYFLLNDYKAALIEVIKARKLLKSFWKPWIPLETRIHTVSKFREVIYGFKIKTLEDYTDLVRDFNFSPDGNMIAFTSSDKTVKLWDTKTGTEIRTLRGHEDLVRYISFSPNNKILASISGNSIVKFWNTKTGTEISTLQSQNQFVHNIIFDFNGKNFFGESADVLNLLHYIIDGKADSSQIASYSFNDGANTHYPKYIRFSSDGKIVAAAYGNNIVKLWGNNTKVNTINVSNHENNPDTLYLINHPRYVSFSPDAKTLVTISSDDIVKLWNVKTGLEITTLKGHTDSILSINFSSDSKIISTTSADKTVKIWDAKTGIEIKTLEGHTDSILSISFSPDSKIIATASADRTVKIWDAKTGIEIKTLKGHIDFVWYVRFSPDSKTITSASIDNVIKIWDTKTGLEIRKFNTASTQNMGKLLDTKTDIEFQTFNERENGSLLDVSFNPDGKTLASASSNTVKLWNYYSGKIIKVFNGHTDSVQSVSFSPNGKIIASASYDKTVRLWDIETKKEIITLKGHREKVNSVSFSPNGKIIASASDDTTVKLWDIETKKEITTLKGHRGKVNSVSFSPNGKIIASASDDTTVKLWDIETKKEIKTLKEHKITLRNASFSPNGKIIASTYSDNIILWDINTGKKIRSFKTDSIEITFSSDSNILASTSTDDKIKLWDVNTGQEIKTLKGHTDTVRSVKFSPDGKTLVSTSRDGNIILWNFDLDNLLVRGCRLIRGYLQNNPDVSAEDRHLCDDIKL